MQELVGNPLTLGLLAEVSLEGEGLPESKTKLLESASGLLLKEKNPAHAASPIAQARVDDLLLSAGAVAAHLLISGSAGIFTGSRDALPAGFVHVSEIADLPNAPLTKEVLKTRLFRTEGEGLFVPVHRVLAEYLGARWLSRRLHAGLSERRLLQMLEFAGGVPTSLRGLHAWLGHFTPSLADRCIKTDPYGVLRYGETDQLPIPRARLLLSSLATLAKEDPYFRSEDWGTRALSGLARPELKNEIIAVVRSPDRHFHLSSLLLEALPGSTLTKEIVPELLALIRDSTAAHAERHHAAEALIASRAKVDWPAEVATLAQQAGTGDKRLAVEIISQLKGEGFTGQQIANALVDLLGIDRNERDDNFVSGTDYYLVRQLSPAQCAATLDGIRERIAATPRPSYWNPNHHLASTIQRLTAKALQGSGVSARRFWSWVRFVDARTSYSAEPKDSIKDYLTENTPFRREVQRIALGDKSIDGGPWMAIVHELPQANPGLAITPDDAVSYLEELVAKDTLTDADVILWTDLVRALGRPERHAESIAKIIARSTAKHPRLAERWKELTRPPERDWEKEEQRRQAKHRRSQAAKFARHRANFAKVKEGIATGQAFGALHSLALGYLSRYADLDAEAAPLDRLRQWVGEDIAIAASKGFVAALSRNDLPTVEKVAEIRNEGKHWNIEAVMMCGVAELVRTGQSLESVSEEVAKAVLAVWWDMPEFNSTKLGEDMQKQLEARVFHSDDAAERFLVAVLEPAIKAGKEHISGLYRLPRDPRFKRIAASLALRWLQTYQQAKQPVQRELLQICLHEGSQLPLAELVSARLANSSELDPVAHRMWTAAAFMLDLPESRDHVAANADSDKSLLWSIKDLMRPDSFESRHFPLTVSQREFIVQKFAPRWPVAAHPSSAWGDENSWNATEFINSCIDAIGGNPSSNASDALDRLSQSTAALAYGERVKHVRAQQRRLRRDKEHVPPSFDQTKKTLADGPPGTIDDLKAVMMDTLAFVQDYVRNADTDGWEAYWNGNQPKIENTCRDRVLDALRPQVSKKNVDLLPESSMPEKNRADILALHDGKGLPIEVKGQWHPDVWDASKTQLDDKYGRDWRADGRGIYLVLWFGPTQGKGLASHPDGLPAPASPAALQTMLLDRLGESERARIEVLVLDVSKPPPKKASA